MHNEFEQMIVENQGRIRYIASRYAHSGEFDDMYQEILLQLWRSFKSFQGAAKRETWVYKVALNTAFSFVRKVSNDKKNKQQLIESIVTDSSLHQDNCQADLLNTFMNTLTDTDANILMMYLDGLSSDDSAEVIGISSSAVRSRIKRIKQEFERNFVGGQ